MASRHPNSVPSMASFMASVRLAGEGDASARDNLVRASASTISQESSGSDGGYAVPVDFQKAVTDAVVAESVLLDRCTVINVKSNSVAFPVDTQPAYSSSGPKVRLTPEGTVATQSKLKVESRTLRLSKLVVDLPMSAELIEDAGPELDAYLSAVVGSRMAYHVNNEILRGNGTSEALGILSSPALITVSPEGAQSAATVVFANVAKMHSRLIASQRASAVWLVHPSAEQQLHGLNAAAGGLVYQAVPGSPFMSLLGLPVIPVEAASTVGTVGDITLVAMKGIAACVRDSGIKRVLSMHAYFDQDLGVYRFSMRLGALTFLAAAVSQKNGGSTVSSVVSLDVRS
jgi:HK97 family phage major capsid protein